MDMTKAHRRLAVAAAVAVACAQGPALAQTTPPATITQTPPGAAAPAAPVPGPASPDTTPTPSAPATPLPTVPPPTSGSRATLIPTPGDPSDVDEVILPEKKVLVLSGSSTWEEGLKTIRAAFARLSDEAAKDGLTIAGRPLSVFTETTDDNFRFDAMIPIEAVPAAPPALPAGMRFGVTPSGKAYRFVHKAPYDDIDTTYETVTTYLDAKDIAAKDAFVEEYLNDVSDPSDPNLEINIFVQPK